MEPPDPALVSHAFDVHEVLRILFGTLITGILLAISFLARDYFRFKIAYAKEALTRDKWEELCKQYRNTCDARVCRKLDSVTKTMEGCATTLSDLTKQLTIVQTQFEPLADKIKEIDIMKERMIRFETELEKIKNGVK